MEPTLFAAKNGVISSSVAADFRRLSADFPPFVPSRFWRGGHLQTLAGVFLPGAVLPYRAHRHLLTLPDGDQLALHDDEPADWSPGDRVVLLIHGLTGSFQSPYLSRVAAKLNARGVRVWRLDLRGCGAGENLARLPYHAGRSTDAAAALDFLAQLCPASPVTLVGFSLGGNLALKLAGESANGSDGNLDSVIAVCPPIELATCTKNLQRRLNRLYDRHFTRRLLRQATNQRRVRDDAPPADLHPAPRGIYEFDNRYTAPLCGFGDAVSYYEHCSARRYLAKIEIPALILAAADDPLIPVAIFADLPASSLVDLHLAPGGGHLGFLARRGIDPDPRWMDWRIVNWIAGWDRLAKACQGANRRPARRVLDSATAVLDSAEAVLDSAEAAR